MGFNFESDLVELYTEVPRHVIDWSEHLVQPPKLWAETGGRGVKVAVMDTGIDYSHPDIAANFKDGIDFTSEFESDYMDRNGHGTHCAGIIGAVGTDRGVIGVAPHCELYAVKVLDDHGMGLVGSIIKGIDWCISKKIDIISFSMGSVRNPGDDLYQAIKRAREKGIIVLAATGNEHIHTMWPAAYNGVMGIGSLSQGMPKRLFSDQEEYTDVVAPDIDIISTYPGNRYSKISGTSMATPMVTGVVALMKSYANANGLSLTLEDVKHKIKYRSMNDGTQKDINYFGNQFINVNKIING